MRHATIYLIKTVVLVTIINCVTFNLGIAGNDSHALAIPKLDSGLPAAGKLVKVTPAEYQGTGVYHTIYLPPNWSKEGAKTSVVFEYTGNYFPLSGSTGEVRHAALGYGLSAGQFIWVSLPYIESNRKKNAITWWGDIEATVNYAKTYVPQIIEEYGGNPDAILLSGFSRGAIAVNFIGLHDDEIAKFWTAFFVHDHFDGVREWKPPWGSPLKRYRKEAKKRIERINGRPYLISQNGRSEANYNFIKGSTKAFDNFQFIYIDTHQILGDFPNQYAKHPHTDKWLLVPSSNREFVWQWIDQALAKPEQ